MENGRPGLSADDRVGAWPPGVPAACASLGNRALGQLVDGLIAVGLFFLVGMWLAGRFGGMSPEGFELIGLPALILLGVVVVVMFGYFTVCEALFGVTLGKIVAEARVTTLRGDRIGARAAIVRNLFRLVDGIGGYLVAAFAVIFTARRV
ncbi:MAG TPA: RDD family protein, partial [Candidatus Binatia bacterium]|nr:RDD family protein [Candidatus Binatia bacterium]